MADAQGTREACGDGAQDDPLSNEDRFEIRNVEGWTVYIRRDVLKDQPQPTEKTLEHLR